MQRTFASLCGCFQSSPRVNDRCLIGEAAPGDAQSKVTHDILATLGTTDEAAAQAARLSVLLDSLDQQCHLLFALGNGAASSCSPGAEQPQVLQIGPVLAASGPAQALYTSALGQHWQQDGKAVLAYIMGPAEAEDMLRTLAGAVSSAGALQGSQGSGTPPTPVATTAAPAKRWSRLIQRQLAPQPITSNLQVSISPANMLASWEEEGSSMSSLRPSMPLLPQPSTPPSVPASKSLHQLAVDVSTLAPTTALESTVDDPLWAPSNYSAARASTTAPPDSPGRRERRALDSTTGPAVQSAFPSTTSLFTSNYSSSPNNILGPSQRASRASSGHIKNTNAGCMAVTGSSIAGGRATNGLATVTEISSGSNVVSVQWQSSSQDGGHNHRQGDPDSQHRYPVSSSATCASPPRVKEQANQHSQQHGLTQARVCSSNNGVRTTRNSVSAQGLAVRAAPARPTSLMQVPLSPTSTAGDDDESSRSLSLALASNHKTKCLLDQVLRMSTSQHQHNDYHQLLMQSQASSSGVLRPKSSSATEYTITPVHQGVTAGSPQHATGLPPGASTQRSSLEQQHSLFGLESAGGSGSLGTSCAGMAAGQVQQSKPVRGRKASVLSLDFASGNFWSSSSLDVAGSMRPAAQGPAGPATTGSIHLSGTLVAKGSTHALVPSRPSAVHNKTVDNQQIVTNSVSNEQMEAEMLSTISFAPKSSAQNAGVSSGLALPGAAAPRSPPLPLTVPVPAAHPQQGGQQVDQQLLRGCAAQQQEEEAPEPTAGGSMPPSPHDVYCRISESQQELEGGVEATVSSAEEELLTHSPTTKSLPVTATVVAAAPALDPSLQQGLWEVSAQVVLDPVTGRPSLALTHKDVTRRTALEQMVAAMSEAQLALLSEVFPRHVIELLARGQPPAAEQLGHLAASHEGATILFCDVVGFTAASKQVPASEVMHLLNKLFGMFDALCDVHGVQKLETAGDAYLVSCGVLAPDDDNFLSLLPDHDHVDSARRVLAFARDMQAAARTVVMPDTGDSVRIRIGIHTGPVMSGVIGSKLPKFGLFGDSMNLAARLETSCPPGRIHVSAATARLLPEEGWEPVGGVELKGQGRVETFLLAETLHEDQEDTLLQMMTTLPSHQEAPAAATAATSSFWPPVTVELNGMSSSANALGTAKAGPPSEQLWPLDGPGSTTDAGMTAFAVLRGSNAAAIASARGSTTAIDTPDLTACHAPQCYSFARFRADEGISDLVEEVTAEDLVAHGEQSGGLHGQHGLPGRGCSLVTTPQHSKHYLGSTQNPSAPSELQHSVPTTAGMLGPEHPSQHAQELTAPELTQLASHSTPQLQHAHSYSPPHLGKRVAFPVTTAPASPDHAPAPPSTDAPTATTTAGHEEHYKKRQSGTGQDHKQYSSHPPSPLLATRALTMALSSSRNLSSDLPSPSVISMRRVASTQGTVAGTADPVLLSNYWLPLSVPPHRLAAAATALRQHSCAGGGNGDGMSSAGSVADLMSPGASSVRSTGPYRHRGSVGDLKNGQLAVRGGDILCSSSGTSRLTFDGSNRASGSAGGSGRFAGSVGGSGRLTGSAANNRRSVGRQPSQHWGAAAHMVSLLLKPTTSVPTTPPDVHGQAS